MLWNLIDSFTGAFFDLEINYFNKEIELLEADIIITMNLEKLNVLGKIESVNHCDKVSFIN